MPITNKVYVFTTVFSVSPVLIGRLTVNNEEGTFEYAPDYLKREDRFPVDPVNLPLNAGSHTTRMNKGVFNAFLDSTPDAWGKKLLNKLLVRPPRDNLELLLMSSGGVGSLLYSASRTSASVPDHVIAYTAGADDIVSRLSDIENAPDSLPDFVKAALYATSALGGARPKLLLQDEGKQYIAKLNKENDIFNVCRIEASMLALAKEVNIRTPNFQIRKIGDREGLLVERFDRVGDRRLHYLSAHSLLNGHKFRQGDEAKHISYAGIAGIIRNICKNPKEDAQELFRRAALNIVVGNTDDHLKNHGFLMDGAGWYSLAPVFDIVPQPNQTKLQAIGVGLTRESSLTELLYRCADFYLTKDAAVNTIGEIKQAAAMKLPTIMRDLGVSSGDGHLVMGIVKEKSLTALAAKQTAEPHPASYNKFSP